MEMASPRFNPILVQEAALHSSLGSRREESQGVRSLRKSLCLMLMLNWQPMIGPGQV